MEGLKSRAVALIVCLVLILVGWFGGSAIQAMNGGALITAKASGLKADTVVMQVGDADVTAGEYLYWLASVCDGFYQYYGISDWSMAMTADLTVGDYAMAQADDYATQYAAVELLAKEQGITLSEEQAAVMDSMHEYYVEYYGSEEVYRYMLAYAGLNEELLKRTAPFHTSMQICARNCWRRGASWNPPKKTWLLLPSATAIQIWEKKNCCRIMRIPATVRSMIM